MLLYTLTCLLFIGQFGRLVVDSKYCTTHPHIYAIGDAVGGNLASTAFLQGRSVSNILFSKENIHSHESREEGMDCLLTHSLAHVRTHLVDLVGAQDSDEEGDIDAPIDDFFSPINSHEHNNDPLFLSTPVTLWSLPELASVGHTSESARNLGCLLTH